MTRAGASVLAALAGCSACFAETPGADFHVAPKGNDRWSGRLAAPKADRSDGPFATLARARDAVRGLKKDRPVTVLVRAGTYRLAGTLAFRPADSGTQAGPVTYAAWPGERPVVSGGRVVTERFSNKPGSEVWSVRLPKGTWFQDLYVNGVRQRRARMPNEGFWKARRIGDSRTSFGYGAGQLRGLPDAASGFAVLRPYQWCEFHLPLAGVDEAKRTVALAKPCGYPVVPTGYGAPGLFRIENVALALDEPGEWCLDRQAGLLHYIPRKGIDPNAAEVVAAKLPVLVSLTGEYAKGRFVEHVRFRGLTFRHSGRCEKTEWGLYAGVAVRLSRGVRQCAIEACRFADTGGGGVALWKECMDNRIVGNEFVGTGETAVAILDYLTDGPPASRGNRIADNHIHHCGVVKAGAKAVSVSMSEGNHIAGNHIHHMPYNGISLSGMTTQHWGRRNAPSLKPPFTAAKIKPFVRTRGNVVERNHIHHVMQELGDGGAIYFWGVAGEGPNRIRNNLIHDVGRPGELAVGLYLDDQMEDVEVRDNVVIRANWGLHLHGCSRCLIENNVFAHSRDTDVSIQPEKYNTAPMLNVIRRNVFYMGAKRLYRSHNLARGNRPLKEMNRNLYWRGGRGPLKIGIAPGFDADSLVADPLFVAPESGDFRYRPSSPAGRLGIKPIDTSRRGTGGR